MNTYKSHPAYIAYINNNVRPDERLLPAVMSNTEGQYFINPSEVYCRWRVAEDAICGSSGKFSSESALRNHYLKCHKITLEPRRPGQLDNKTKNDMIRWYASLGGNIQHNWAPRKARDRGKSPDSGPSPSLLSLHYSGVPTPLYGPGVRPSMPVDDEMTIKSPSHDQAPRRQANVPNDPAPPGPSLPEGNESAPDLDLENLDNEDMGAIANSTLAYQHPAPSSDGSSSEWGGIEALPCPMNKDNSPYIAQMRRDQGFFHGEKCARCMSEARPCPPPRQYDLLCDIWAQYENPFE